MDKKQWKTVAISAATLLLLFLLVIWVFRDHYQEILRNIQAVSIRELLLLLGMGLAYQMLESAVCFAMIRRRLPTFSYRQAVEVTFLGVFGNVSTLSVGSVPMQSYYLHHCGMMTGCGIGTMMLEYIFHKSSVLIYTTVMLLFQGRWLSETGRGFSRYIPLGYGICALIIAALVLLCAWEKVQWFASWVIDHLPNTEKWEGRKRLWKDNLSSLHTESPKLLHDHWCLLKVLLFNGLKLFCLYTIPFLCMEIGKKYRGSLEKVMYQYTKDRISVPGNISDGRVYIVYPSAKREAVDAARQVLTEDKRFTDIQETFAGCTVACHCGPNTIGVMFLED